MPLTLLHRDGSHAPPSVRLRTATQLREAIEARKHFGPQVHLSDIRLGRCAAVPWDALSPVEQASKCDRAAAAIRLWDQDTLADEAANNIADALCAQHALDEGRNVRDVASTAAKTVLATLTGYLGRRG